jgi:hypothetical protein
MSQRQVISAIAAELDRRHGGLGERFARGMDEVTDEIIRCQKIMPDYLHAPMWILTQVFDLAGLPRVGSRFRKLQPEEQTDQVTAWKNSRLEICRNFVRFYESLYLLIVMQETGE